MAIEKKLIHFGKLADFEAQLTAGNILDYSIVFIQDAKKIWTHGTYYDCSEGTAAGDIVQSDWNENDPVSDSYIQGRTHYSYDVEQIALFSIASKNEGDILVTGLYVGGFYQLYNQAGGKSQAFHFVEGRKVLIPSVGPTIEAVCTYEDDYCLKLTTPTYGMNESFLLREMYVEQLKDIYVPETIARTSELKTINGESIYGGGDLTIESGAKIYEWEPIADENGNYNGSLTQEEFENIRDCDILTIYSYPTVKQTYEGYIIVQCIFGLEAIFINISPDLKYQGMTETAVIPTKTSQLENDSNFVTSDGLKTINGESILGSGDITISGGGEDIRYFTEFTVEQILESIEQTQTIMQTNNSELFTAMQNNKLVCIPYKDNANGFVVASYNEESSYINFLEGRVIYKLELAPKNITINPIYLSHNTVYRNNTSPWIEDVYDNSTYIESNPATGTSQIRISEDLLIGSTIRFTTGENCSLTISGRGANNLLWANGVMPTIEPGVTYELSLRTDYTDTRRAYAVLTPFKPVE